MKRKSSIKKSIIIDFINQYYNDYQEIPTLRVIEDGTNIPLATVQRYMKELGDEGVITYEGRNSIVTERIKQESPLKALPVIGYVACGEGQEEQEEVLEYIRLPESWLDPNDCFALIAKGESMIDAGIYPGDYVIVGKDKPFKSGDIVVALYEGKNNLKKIILGNDSCILRSCNKDKNRYKDIKAKDLKIQGVAELVVHRLNRGK